MRTLSTESRAPKALSGPEFSSYPADDVSWLLTDLSLADLEQPAAVREIAMQNGGHYSETLPIEYEPGDEYLQLYARALARSGLRLAQAVATVAGAIYDRYGSCAVLASLARAGTPAGILLRRFAAARWAVDWPHYTISIIRDRGIDHQALAYIAQRHNPGHVVWVDGWTGKGAITRQLLDSLKAPGLADGYTADLAVLADPGRCASLSGTRDDFLIPSACLNSTVSGLVSRTVYRPDLTGPEAFHGAKFYAHLQSVDRSLEFLSEVGRHFSDVEPLDRDQPPPQWTGWNAIEQLAHDLGLADINLVKPGVGETTRVLLRRIPWKILINPEEQDSPDLEHILVLASERGVPVELRPGLLYSCAGVIRPMNGETQQ